MNSTGKLPRPTIRLPLIGALTAVLAGCLTYPPPPRTRVDDVVDTIHGVAIPDPYRWLENRDAAETREWIDVQNTYAEQVVGESPLRTHIEERLGVLMGVTAPPSPRTAGDYQYFSMRRGNQDLPVIYRRPLPDDEKEREALIDPTGEYEVVLDPHGVGPQNTTRYSIVTFSGDGNLMIYNERDGGMDELKIRVRDLERGADLADSLPLSLYGSISFSNDNTGFYYVKRSREIGPRVMYHELGTELSADEVTFGEGYPPETFINMSQAANGRYRIYGVQHGWARTEVHFQDMRRGGAIQTIVDDVDARYYTQFIDGELYMRTNDGANNSRLVAVNLGNPGRENWREVIPENEYVMENFVLIEDKFYVTYIDNVSNRIKIFERDGTPTGEVPVPDFHTASIRGAGDGEALLTLSSFLTPSKTFKIDLATGERTVWDEREVDWNSDGFVIKQVWRTSMDGTRVPMFIVHHRDTELNGRNPTLLTGYGGFYVARKPGFSTTAALWLEMGGVYALATLRGGSEFGESWHRDGMLENKQNVFDDFISAGEWLIDNGYTNSDKLAIQGGSNGGLLVGAAFTQRPDLFRAVLCAFPDVDILRFPWYTKNNNAPALLEYGNSQIPELFEAIRQYSPYQSVQPRTRYPAVMFTTGDLDTRVPPLGARKMTARLQASTTSGYPIVLRYHPKAGHAAGRGVPFSRRVVDTAMELTFVAQQLGLGLD